MHPELNEIPIRIMGLAKAALAQANTHAIFADPGNEHWPSMSILNAAHAGELFLKAIIAPEHPLLIFKDLPLLDDPKLDYLDINTLLNQGRTQEFERLPQLLWVAKGKRIQNQRCFQRVRRARNAIQHFCLPEDQDLSALSLEFIYTIIDPLMFENLGLHAIEYHEDHSIGYDYLVRALINYELEFSVPLSFNVTEINIMHEVKGKSEKYRRWASERLMK